MLFKLTHIPLCLFRNKHTVLKLGRVISCRLEDSSRNYWTSPVQETVSRCIAARTKLLENHTWMIHKVPKRNFLQREPEDKPFFKSNPKKDGLLENRYELIYVNDTYLIYKRCLDLLLAVSLIFLPFLCYLIYTDTETKDVDLSKPMEIPTKYRSSLGFFAVYVPVYFRCVATLRRSPYRMYKLRNTHGLDSQYVAILPDRMIFTKKLPFSLGEYKELPEPLGFVHRLLHGNTYIKDKSYMISEDCFVSPHYHNELNGFF
ncbi:uncharacterized protein [Argopecten irradians]|uniref:uncharacterized protein n=1 Tax=Argopecten irradians TaxID=31199 RepID=UPI00370F9155